jgi:hypothetical protein
MTDLTQEIHTLVKSRLSQVFELDIFKTWISAESIEKDDLILINNSFVFRDKIKTTKNSQYLGLIVTGETINLSELQVASGVNINSDFKTIKSSARNLPSLIPFADAIDNELISLGKLVLVLVGQIDRSLGFDEQINHSLFNQLRLVPSSNTLITLDRNNIVINRIVDEELLWGELAKLARADGLIADDLPENLVKPLTDALDNLKKNSYIVLRLPEDPLRIGDTFLDSIIAAMKDNIQEYQTSLTKCTDEINLDPLEFKNVLRIAYNFAGDAITLIRLLISICDLKPLIFWMTIKEQILLSEAFRSLPWKRMSTKPSLDEYFRTICGARNSAFHHLFPFDRAIEVQLEGVSITAKRLRLFSEYTSKSKNLFEFEDQQLIELLTEFTRTEEIYVSPEFWQRNLNVMIATIELLSSVCASLKLLAKYRSE